MALKVDSWILVVSIPAYRHLTFGDGSNKKKEESRDLLRSRHITGHLNTGASGGVSRLRGPRSPHSAGKVSNFQPVGSSSGQQRNSTLFQ